MLLCVIVLLAKFPTIIFVFQLGREKKIDTTLLKLLKIFHITQNKYRYDHMRRVGDVLFWDNRCLIHSVNVDYPVGQERRHQRILLKGSRPI